MRILQWNICGIKKKIPEISKRCSEFDILIFSETLLRPQDICNIYGFDCIRQDRSAPGKRGGGVGIFIRRTIKYSSVPVLYSGNGEIEACAQIFSPDGPLVIVAVYRPPRTSNMSIQDWSRFFNQFPQKSIFCGDFNAHHLLWDDTKCNVGYKIKDSLENSDHTILNDQSFTFHSSAHKTFSAIDLSISHTSLCLSTNWEIGNDNWGSDHFPIFIRIGCQITPPPPIHYFTKRYSKNINWDGFRNRVHTALEDNLLSLSAIEDLNVKYSSFLAIISDALTFKPNLTLLLLNLLIKT